MTPISYKIMQDREYNENGIFRFYFWIKDGWYGVNVNDELPMNTPTEPFSAQQTQAGAWWMPLLEKAYAKMQ